MLTELSRDESKRLAAIDLLKNPDKGRDDALKKIYSSNMPIAEHADGLCFCSR